MATQNLDLVSQIAAQRLGPDPAAAAAAAAAAAQGGSPATAQPPAPPKASSTPTDMERAQSKVAPDADAGADESAVKFLKLGDQEYTEDQLKGTMSRYRDLNFKWQSEVAPNKAALEVIRQIRDAAKQNGHEPTGDEVAKLVQAAVAAYVKNPQMGGNQGGKPSGEGDGKAAMSGNDDMDKVFSDWEKENAVKLPPGFREMAAGNKRMEQQLGDVINMFKAVIQGGMAGQNQAAAGQQALQQGQHAQADAATRLIATNLSGAFQSNGLNADDQTRADFRIFATQRGYDIGDFLDPELTAMVVKDYKVNKDAPEVQRLREIAKRRAAFTGSTDGSPAAGVGAPAQGAGAGAGADPMLTKLIGMAAQQRGI